MKRKVSSVFAGALCGAVTVFAVTHQALFAGGTANAQVSENYRELNLFAEIFQRILDDYVDEKTEAELIEAAINGLVGLLDPHSQYYTPTEFHAFQAGLSGQFGGLGIEVTMGADGLVRVVSPIDNTPAERAGIAAGDFIVGIDGTQVLGMTLDQAIAMMRGEPDTEITITIKRDGVVEPFDVTLMRAMIRSPQVRAEIFDDVAYLRLTVFGTQTFDEFSDALAELTAEIGPDRVVGYILDLRNNGGGSLDTAIAIADGFLDAGEIVSTRGREEEDFQRYLARRGDLTNGRPLVVLINGGSASASEIVAGALQDQGRATIVGAVSFGKGSVQTVFPLGTELGAIRLTTARYYTPSGRSIQDVGVIPDIAVDQPLPQAVLERMGGELPVDDNGDPITTFDIITRDPADDAQLQYVLRLLHGEEIHPAFPPRPQASVAN
jgi:carboxyl-terminal processing protease